MTDQIDIEFSIIYNQKSYSCEIPCLADVIAINVSARFFINKILFLNESSFLLTILAFTIQLSITHSYTQSMKKTKYYFPVQFSAEILAQTESAFINILPENHADLMKPTWQIRTGNEEWTYDNSAEFYNDYRRHPSQVFLFYNSYGTKYSFHFQIVDSVSAQLRVEAPTRSEIESVFTFLDEAESSSIVEHKTRQDISIFIGHGRSTLWRDLKDHLHDHHGYNVVAYEIGSRTGHAIRDILEDMLNRSSIALLVFTAEDVTSSGNYRARQNVIHELGLFQGKLGFSRGIIILEKGVEEFSNIAGIQQIRFNPGNIREVYGDVLATLRRELTLD